MPGNSSLDKGRLRRGFDWVVRRLGYPGVGTAGPGVRGCWRLKTDVELGDHLLRIKRNKSSASETSSNVVARHCRLVRCEDRGKEVLLGDVGYACPHHPLDLLAVGRLERAETANIEWLEDVR